MGRANLSFQKAKAAVRSVARPLTGPVGSRGSWLFTYGALALFFGFYAYANYIRFYIAEPFTYGLGMLFQLSLGDIVHKFFEFHYYPPLYAAFCDLATYFGGYEYLRVLFINSLLLPPTALYVTLLFREMSDDSPLAPLAGGLVLLSASYVYYVIPICIEMLLTLTVPAYLYHLAASRRFLNRYHSGMAGFWASLGMLTKWTFPIYVFAATLLATLVLLYDFDARRFRLPKKQQWLNIALALGVLGLLCGWWYAMLPLEWFFKTARNAPSFIEYSIILNLQFYLVSCLGRFHPELVYLLAFFFVFFWLFRRPWWCAAVVVCGMLIPTLLLGASIHIEDRYLFPLIPVFSFVTIYLPSQARNKYVGLALAGLLMFFATNSHFEVAKDSFTPTREKKAALAARRPPPDAVQALLNGEFRESLRDLPGAITRRLEVTDGNFEYPSFAGQSEAILRTLLQKIGPVVDDKLIRVAVHPLWYNPHLRGEFYKYHLARRRLADKISVDFFIPEAYNRFHRGLVAGIYDVVLLDCGEDNDCMNTRRGEMERVVSESLTQPYITIHDGSSYGSFDLDRIADGLRYLYGHYDEAAVMNFHDDTCSRIYLNRRLTSRRDAAAPPSPE
jgi:hypothetical protein